MTNISTAELLKSHGQKVFGGGQGDCFRASMSYVLLVPNGDHLPNVHSKKWFSAWCKFLGQFGFGLSHDGTKGPIWREQWLATVPSKNLAGVTHSIVMADSAVAFDPSQKRRYRRGMNLLTAGIVRGGTWLTVIDASKLDRFVDWRKDHR